MAADTEEKLLPRNAIRLFRVAGIQITIDYSWFIVFALVTWSLSAGYFPRTFPGQTFQVYWTAGLIATLLLFVSILIHELSHSLVAMHSGIKIPEITFFIFGGVSRISEEAKDPVTELKIALAGPASSFAIALVFRILEAISHGTHAGLISAIFGYLVWINVALGVFNLIPGFPLDGGRVLRAVIWWRTNSLARATKWASDLGKGFAIALMFMGAVQIFSGILIGGLWSLFIGLFLRGVAEGGYQQLMVRQCLEDVRVDEVMTHNPVTVSPQLSISRLIEDYFMHYGYRGFPVVEGETVAGVISLAEVKDVLRDQQDVKTVGEVMVPIGDRLQITPETSLAEAFTRMTQENLSRLVVMHGNNLSGMITRTGLLRFLEIRRILEVGSCSAVRAEG